MVFFLFLFLATLVVSQLPRLVMKQKPMLLSFLLSFSGAFLLGITLLHIFPELYGNPNDHFKVGIFIIIGFFVQVILESYSKGIEHGHIHLHDFKKVPYSFFLALCVHALLEGSALVPPYSLKLGSAILIHKIPVAFLLGLLVLSTLKNRAVGFLLLIAFSISTPLGAYLSGIFEGVRYFGTPLQLMLMAMATGSFLHVSTTILFETSPEHKLKISKLLPALCGGLLAIIMSLMETH